ncbi:hypothetical protein, partial [Corallococcus sp. CA031C]|uniref:hypothetical protein n=1 Tax=Corallococcus sp. CA031C TaxID=2316725 RepID=UPI000EC68D9C
MPSPPDEADPFADLKDLLDDGDAPVATPAPAPSRPITVPKPPTSAPPPLPPRRPVAPLSLS